MGLMSVALDLLLLIHPMSNVQDELKEVSSSRQDLKNDMQDLEAAGFLKPCKETPDSWDFAQVPLSPPHSPPHSLPLPSPSPPFSCLCLACPYLLFPGISPITAPLHLSLVCCCPAAVLRCALCTYLYSNALCSAG